MATDSYINPLLPLPPTLGPWTVNIIRSANIVSVLGPDGVIAEVSMRRGLAQAVADGEFIANTRTVTNSQTLADDLRRLVVALTPIDPKLPGIGERHRSLAALSIAARLLADFTDKR